MNLYITADQVGGWQGGSQVTYHESEALKELGPCDVLGREQIERRAAMIASEDGDPWHWDAKVRNILYADSPRDIRRYKLAHFYAGTFSGSVKDLKEKGCKITYTAAAHNIELSRREHERLGIPFNYPHLTDPVQWQGYVAGYLAADIVICPSLHSAECMRGYGASRVEVIPHGVTLPEKPPRFPDKFTVGYLGATGPDKGLIYLLMAWKKLNYKDARLIIGGSMSQHPFTTSLINQFGGGEIVATGFYKDVSDFYDSISLYVQPSVSEGFGIEVLEAVAHGKPVLCSKGAGAVDILPSWFQFEARGVDEMVSKISQVRDRGGMTDLGYPNWRGIAEQYTWDKIRERYKILWRSLL